MAYVAASTDELQTSAPKLAPWKRSERLAVVVGASAFGALMGFAATVAVGRVDVPLIAIASFMIVSLSLGVLTLWRTSVQGSVGCGIATALHMVALAAWPMTMAMSQTTPAMFWVAPTLALSALALFASCWRGGSWAIYGASAQALVLAALASHQGIFLAMGA